MLAVSSLIYGLAFKACYSNSRFILSASPYFLNFPGLADQLVGEAISHVFLNPLVWVYASYIVQRELYMFLIHQFDNDLRLLSSHCRLPRTLDIIRQYYWDVKSKSSIGSKPLLHPVTRKIIGERPNEDEIRKIRLLLLGLGEMSLRYGHT